MITILSGTNRKDNFTKKIALEYRRLLGQRGQESSLIALDETDMSERNAAFIKIEDELLIPAERFIIISPEYNGSFAGILKLMIDNSEVSKVWWHKKVLLTGISTGRAGNLRGMEHLTGILLHLKMVVHPNRLPISNVHSVVDSGNRITDSLTLAAINLQLDEFLQF